MDVVLSSAAGRGHCASKPTPADLWRSSLSKAIQIERQLEEGTLNLDVEEALALQLALKRDLREQTGVNTFLATDSESALEDMNAATQSVETRRRQQQLFSSHLRWATISVGGIETSSVGEHLLDARLCTEVAFYRDRNDESAMIEAVSARWHITVDDFESYADLFKAIRAHFRTIV